MQKSRYATQPKSAYVSTQEEMIERESGLVVCDVGLFGKRICYLGEKAKRGGVFKICVWSIEFLKWICY